MRWVCNGGAQCILPHWPALLCTAQIRSMHWHWDTCCRFAHRTLVESASASRSRSTRGTTSAVACSAPNGRAIRIATAVSSIFIATCSGGSTDSSLRRCGSSGVGVGVGVRRRGRAATQGHRVGPERSVGPRGDAIGSCLKGRRVWAETRCRGALFAQRGEGLPDAEHGAEGHDHVVGALRHLHPHLRLGVVADSPKKRRAQLGRRTRARE